MQCGIHSLSKIGVPFNWRNFVRPSELLRLVIVLTMVNVYIGVYSKAVKK
jgi:hypothetical protein